MKNIIIGALIWLIVAAAWGMFLISKPANISQDLYESYPSNGRIVNMWDTEPDPNEEKAWKEYRIEHPEEYEGIYSYDKKSKKIIKLS